MKKNEIFTVKCLDVSHDAYGICSIDNYKVFVKNLLKGEKAKIKIIKVKKNVAFAIVVELLEESIHRISHCSVSNKCGGCPYSMMDYQSQLQLKENRLKQCISQIAKLDLEVENIIASPEIYRYRNKVSVPVRDGKVGFYRSHSNDIVEFDDCLVQTKLSNSILKKVEEIIKELKISHLFKHILIKHAHNSNEVMLVLVVKDLNILHLDELIKEISSFEEIKTIVLNLNTREDNVILGDVEKIVFGNGYIIENLDDLKFRISSKAFYQINSSQISNLYKLVGEYANLSKDTKVLDLFCGTGTIGIYLADKVKKVVGVDIVESAINDAKYNVDLNNLDNVDFICDDANKAVSYLKDEHFDLVVVDPPRKGLKEEAIKLITDFEAQEIIYVSCDPATLARDLNIFKNLGYEVNKIQPVDMFPFTPHVETVVLMSRVEK